MLNLLPKSSLRRLASATCLASIIVLTSATVAGCVSRVQPQSACARGKVRDRCHGDPDASGAGTGPKIDAWNACVQQLENECSSRPRAGRTQPRHVRSDSSTPRAREVSGAPADAPGGAASVDPPDAKDVEGRAVSALSAALSSCGGVARRALLAAELGVAPEGRIAHVEVETSTLSEAKTLDCMKVALGSLTTRPFKIPNGKHGPADAKTVCPPGVENAPLLQFKCKQVRTGYLPYRVMAVLEPSGDVARLGSLPAQELLAATYGPAPTAIVGGGENVGVLDSQQVWWAPDASGKPMHCERAADPKVAGVLRGAQASGKGWCFAVSCDGGETGHVGLRRPKGGDVCAKPPTSSGTIGPAP